MSFSFISGRRCAKTKRTSGKVACGRVYGWLLLMAVLAGQVEAQECATSNSEVPLCNLAIEPSPSLLLGESFNVTCTFNPQDCSTCYEIVYILDIPELGIADSDNLSEIQLLTGTQDSISKSADGCVTTLSFIKGNNPDRGYIGSFNNTQWTVMVELSSNIFIRKGSDQSITTQVQGRLSNIPQGSIKTTIVQPLDIVMNIIALSNNQQIEGSYRARGAMVDWPHADSLESLDGTFFDRQYIINGTTGEPVSTTDNSTYITLNSEQVDQGFTLITKNQLGVGGSTFFQPTWPEPSIRLTQQEDGRWLVEVNSKEPVTDLEIKDSLMDSIVLSDLNINTNTNADPINSALTFTANLMYGQSYTLRLNLQNITTTQEIQATMQESQATLNEYTPNFGIRSQALPQLLATAAIAALVVNQLMSVRTP